MPPPFEAERDANPPLPRPADRSPSLRLVNPPRFGLLLTLTFPLFERDPLLFLDREEGPLCPCPSSSSLRREKELRLVDILASPEEEGSGSDAADGGWKPRPPELVDRHAGPNRGCWDVSLLIVDVM